MKESKINYFIGKKYPGKEEISVYSILKAFKTTKFKRDIELARSLYQNGDFEGYELVKGRLKAVTFSGTFYPTRSVELLRSYSGFIVVDIDNCGEKLEYFKENLKLDCFVHALWLSPSGNGLKFLVKTTRDATEHKSVYRSVALYFKENYELEVDTSGSDLARLCYVSFDSDLYLNQDAIPYNDMLEIKSAKLKDRKETYDLFNGVVHIDKKHIKNNSFDKLRVKKIYHFLKKRNLSITNTYEDWVRVAFAFSNSFNYDFGHKWFLDFARLDGSDFDEAESIKLIKKCYSIGVSNSSFGTIIYLSQQKGFQSN